MVVDRGGLRYPVEVVDLFSKNLQKFRAEIRASREEFSRFRRQSRLATTQVSKQELSARREAAAASREEARAERQRLQRIQAGARQQQQVQTLRARMFKNERIERERAQRTAERAAKQQARAAEQQARAAKKAETAQARLNRRVKATDNSAQQLLFTFRRLVGVLALFTLARQLSQGFAALVKSGFEFNQTLEQTRLGIAGIITAVAQVRDGQGRLLEGAEAFVAAQVSARRQQQLLRQDALRTTATFQELLEAFQIALGPGLAAGFNLDQVRRFSVLISQAASNIGLPQRQLSEEIRAILTGNIRQTTTRIAQVLNLTNKEVRKLKAQGADVFFAELQQRLQGFALGAESAAQTVGGLFVRLKDVLELVAGTAATGAFETLRGVLKELFDALTLTEKGEFGDILRPDPEAQKAFEAIFQAIDRILRRMAELGRSIGIEGLTTAAEVLATTLEVAGGFVAGIVEGIQQVAILINASLSPLSELVGGSEQISLSAVEIANNLGIIFSLMTAVNLVAGKVKVNFLRMGVILVAVGATLQQLINAFTGLELTLSDTLEIIRLTFTEVFGRVIARLKIAFKEFANSLVLIFTSPFAEITRLFQKLVINPIAGALALLAQIPGGIGKGFDDVRVGLEKLLAPVEQAIDKLNQDRQVIFDTTKDEENLDKFIQESFQKIVAFRSNIILRGVVGEGFDIRFKINGEEPKVGTDKVKAEFTALTTILRGVITSFSQFIAQSISDAFDPTTDVSIKERFARFLQQLAKLIIAQLVQLAIAKALLGFGAPAASLPGVATGRQKGGRIPGRGSQASLAHYTMPQGLHTGGQATPPKGISRKDTTPIWAQPGEYMMRLSAVQKYGLGGMEALNRGLIDPGALSSMAGSRRLSRNTRRQVGFQTGGQIASQAETAAGSPAGGGGGGGDAPSLGAALLVANETTAERLLAGGSKAVLDFIDEHGADIEGRLSRFRS
jgi:hypothetical protein